MVFDPCCTGDFYIPGHSGGCGCGGLAAACPLGDTALGWPQRSLLRCSWPVSSPPLTALGSARQTKAIVIVGKDWLLSYQQTYFLRCMLWWSILPVGQAHVAEDQVQPLTHSRLSTEAQGSTAHGELSLDSTRELGRKSLPSQVSDETPASADTFTAACDTLKQRTQLNLPGSPTRRHSEALIVGYFKPLHFMIVFMQQ